MFNLVDLAGVEIGHQEHLRRCGLTGSLAGVFLLHSPNALRTTPYPAQLNLKGFQTILNFCLANGLGALG